MKIFLGCDHAGINEKDALKEMLISLEYDVEDYGVQQGEKADYPDISQAVSDKVLANENSVGFLICGTGIGISIKANRNKGIRAAIAYDEFSAQMSKEHNDANIVCFGARTMGEENILKYAQIFLNTEYAGKKQEGERHAKRVAMLDQ